MGEEKVILLGQFLGVNGLEIYANGDFVQLDVFNKDGKATTYEFKNLNSDTITLGECKVVKKKNQNTNRKADLQLREIGLKAIDWFIHRELIDKSNELSNSDLKIMIRKQKKLGYLIKRSADYKSIKKLLKLLE